MAAASKKNKSLHLKKEQFLVAYRKHGTITRAAEEVGIDRINHYQWMEGDPEYPARFRAAQEAAIEELEQVAMERAREKSDLLLIFLLKGLNPDKYRERKEIEHTGGDKPLRIIWEDRNNGNGHN